jgi:hypothetical protein
LSELKTSASLIFNSPGDSMLLLSRLVVGVFCFLASALPSFSAKTSQPFVSAQLKPHDMSFQIMRANKPECEPNCPQWIYAEGDIVSGTAAKFNQVLRRAGKAPLLLVIQSRGGDVRSALAMGKAIRSRKMNVAVGSAFSLRCPSGDKFCNETLKSRQISRGFLSSQASFCASACPLILAAGVERIAIADSIIGTHQIISKPMFQKIFYREKYLMVRGRKQILSRTITKRETFTGKVTTKLTPGFAAELERYVRSMGVNGNFLDYYAKAPPSSIYKMSAAERLQTKIITSQQSPEFYARPAICAGAQPAANCVLIKP